MDNALPMLALVVLFMVVSHPRTYDFTAGLVNAVLPDLELVDEAGVPTMMGQVLHGLVLVLLVWLVNTYLLNNNQILPVASQ